jgi:hypothetical protein
MRERNIEEAHRRSTILEKGIYEIGRIGRPRKQNKDRVNSKKVEATIRGKSRKMGDGIMECRRMSEKIKKCIGEGR